MQLAELLGQGRPIVEVYPASMVEGGGASLLEQAYGVVEKTGERVKLPAIFPLKEKAVIYTHNWLSPVIYRFEAERGVMIIADVYPPSPAASYVVESIGGERIRKQAMVGVAYVYTRPYTVKAGYEVEGLTREKLRASMVLSSIELRVDDVKKLLLALWRRHGQLDPTRILEEVRRSFRRLARTVIRESSIEELLANPAQLEARAAEELASLLQEYGVAVEAVEVEAKVPRDVYEYYFWHIVNELPVEYTYTLQVLGKIPDDVKRHAPLVVEEIVKSILERAARREGR